jgi:hypothetical protein
MKVMILFIAASVEVFAGACSGIDTGSSLWGPSGSRPSSDTSGIIRYRGFVPGSATASWRQDIRSSPVDPRSVIWLNDMAAAGGSISPPDTVIVTDIFHAQWDGFVAHYVHGDTQRRIVVRDNPAPRESYPAESDPGTFPIPLGAWIETTRGPNARPWGVALDRFVHSDQQAFVIDIDNCIVYEMFGAYWDGSNISAATYVAFDMLAGDLQRPIGYTSNGVSGLQSWASLMRREEFNSGVIPHALEITVWGGSTTAYAFPASHSQCCGGWNNTHIPFGAKIRLKPGYSNPNLPPGCAPIITALQTYGAVVKDGGRTGDMYGETAYSDWGACRTIYPRTYLTINANDWDVIDTGQVYCPMGEGQSGSANVTNGSTAVTWVSGDKFWDGLPGHTITMAGVAEYVVASVSGCSGGLCNNLVLGSPYTGSSSTVNMSFINGKGVHCTSNIPTGAPPVINSFTATGHTLRWSVSGVVDGDGNPVRLRNISTGATNPSVPCTHLGEADPNKNWCKLGPGWIDGPGHGESVVVDPGGVSRVYTLMVQNRFGRTYASVTVPK